VQREASFFTTRARPSRFWRATALGERRCLSGHPASVVEGVSQQHLDLGVEAAELVSGPPGQRIVNGRIESQRDLLALTTHE
jgi:hypothetical protein